MMKTIDFVIPVFNEESQILQTVESIQSLELPENFSINMIIVDNGSTDSTREKLSVNRIPFILCKTRGRSNARNMGAKKGDASHIVFLDSDTRLSSNWLKECFAALENPLYSAVQGKIIPTGDDRLFLNRYRTAKRSFLGDFSFHYSQFSYPVLNTAACMILRSDFESIGGFDEQLKRAEDTDLTLRLLKNGKNIKLLESCSATTFYTKGLFSYLFRSLSSAYYSKKVTKLHTEHFGLQKLRKEIFLPNNLFGLYKIFFLFEKCFEAIGVLPISLNPFIKKRITTKFLNKRSALAPFVLYDGAKYQLSNKVVFAVSDRKVSFFNSELSLALSLKMDKDDYLKHFFSSKESNPWPISKELFTMIKKKILLKV